MERQGLSRRFKKNCKKLYKKMKKLLSCGWKIYKDSKRAVPILEERLASMDLEIDEMAGCLIRYWLDAIGNWDHRINVEERNEFEVVCLLHKKIPYTGRLWLSPELGVEQAALAAGFDLLPRSDAPAGTSFSGVA